MSLARMTDYLLKHQWQTLAIAFIIAFVPVIGVFGILIAALITLTKNIKEGALLTVVTTLPCLISFYFPSQGSMLFVTAMVVFTVLNNFFTWVFAVLLRQQMNFSTLIQIATLMGVLIVSVVHLVYPNVVEWWGSVLQQYYAQAKTLSSGMLATATTPQSTGELTTLIDNVKQYATGYLVMLVFLSALSTLIIARWWEAKVFKPGILQNELQYIRLNQLTGILFVISLVLAYWGNSVAIDIMPLVNVLFFVAGLSLVHYFFRFVTSRYATFWLVFFYAILILGMPVSGAVLVVLALFDIWFDFRKRFKTAS